MDEKKEMSRMTWNIFAALIAIVAVVVGGITCVNRVRAPAQASANHPQPVGERDGVVVHGTSARQNRIGWATTENTSSGVLVRASVKFTFAETNQGGATTN